MKVCTHMMPPPRPVVNKVVIEIASLESIIDIRHAILREGQPRTSCYYPEDSYKHTVHFAACLNSQLIGCASIYKEKHPDFSLRQAWRIRGMAVLTIFQGQSIGSQLLESCINHAISEKGEVVWCNARSNVVKFYHRAGFKVIGDEFELPNIGSHFLLAKNLGIHFSELKFLQIAKKIFAKQPNTPIPQSKQQS